MNQPTYIEGNELAELLQKNAESVKVVDVRDVDFNEGGHITNAINIPANSFQENVEKYYDLLKSTPILVFHCALSQVRGIL